MNDFARYRLSSSGKETAARLLPAVYKELRDLAGKRLKRELPGQTLSATALVHEAFLRLTKKGDFEKWESKAHFFGAAAIAMRRILREKARHKMSLKQGGELKKIETKDFLDVIDLHESSWAAEFLDLDRFLDQLKTERPAAAELVMLRYFAGLKMADAANVIGVSERTAQRYWRFAKAWLYHRMQG